MARGKRRYEDDDWFLSDDDFDDEDEGDFSDDLVYGDDDDDDEEDEDEEKDDEDDGAYGLTDWERRYLEYLQEKQKRAREAREARERAKAEREKKKREEEERRRARIEEIASGKLPEGYVNPYAADPRARGVRAADAEEGLRSSLSNLGRVDIEYISFVTGLSQKDAADALRGRIYRDPDFWKETFCSGWETADKYLSGNIREKLEKAVKANDRYPGIFSSNVEALRAVMPAPVPPQDIYVTLGSPWVPSHIVEDFMRHLFGVRVVVAHDPFTGSWQIGGRRYIYDPKFFETYGTSYFDATELVEMTLNMKTPTCYDVVYSEATNRYVRKVNRAETIHALDKQKLLVSEFRRWIWEDARRTREIQDIYYEMFGAVRRRAFDGGDLAFPGMAKDVSLYKYQRDAVAKILGTPNVLLAHEVGAGKTYEMVAAGMELRRLGLAKKIMYVVPNNILSQWEHIFKSIYPGADVFTVRPADFVPTKKEMTLRRIAREDHDAVIIPYSSFERIPVSKRFRLREIDDRLAEAGKVPEKQRTTTYSFRVTALKRRRSRIEEEETKRGVTFFDDLGVDRLFLDEAHNYKNLPIETNINGVVGVSGAGSKKCSDMLDKVRLVQSKNGGGGVVFATGTPLTNSVTEAFIMQTYLQPETLKSCGIQTFDAWVGMFGEKVTEFEIDVDTTGYRLATRFSRFHNLPELTTMLGQISDFHSPETADGIPACDGRRDVLVKKTARFDDFLRSVSRRADAVRAGGVDRREDNMLKITTDGRLAALDMRLVDSDAPGDAADKVHACAAEVYEIYRKFDSDKAAQLVFCDTSIPKESFNVYDELRRLLTGYGIPAGEIAYIHDAQSDAVRYELFGKVRRGEVRILIGSTFKMGLGMNVQDRLVALHHIDIPWRPADMVQREGRILRPGNMFDEVYIYRYITEGSFDAYSWQILESKQRFIAEILSGSYGARSSSELRDSVLNYAEVKALAIGNPLIKERVEKANEVATLRILRRKYDEGRADLREKELSVPHDIEAWERRLRDAESDERTYLEAVKEYEGLDEWKAERAEKAKRRKAERGEAAQDAVEEEGSSEGVSSGDDAAEDVTEDAASAYAEEDAESEEISPEDRGKNKRFAALDRKRTEERRAAREALVAAIAAEPYRSVEVLACSYHGFDIYLPPGMSDVKPYVRLRGAGTYEVEIGDKKMGFVTRIDNFLDGFSDLRTRYGQRRDESEALLRSIKEELSKETDYDSMIEVAEAELEDIDRRLEDDGEETERREAPRRGKGAGKK